MSLATFGLIAIALLVGVVALFAFASAAAMRHAELPDDGNELGPHNPHSLAGELACALIFLAGIALALNT